MFVLWYFIVHNDDCNSWFRKKAKEGGNCPYLPPCERPLRWLQKYIYIWFSNLILVHLHDVFESETFIFLVFEICRNGELFDYLTNVVTLSEKKTRYIMRQLFEAVQHVHNQGVVHRDIKPENILLDDALDIKLTDFGFASILEPGQLLTGQFIIL